MPLGEVMTEFQEILLMYILFIVFLMVLSVFTFMKITKDIVTMLESRFYRFIIIMFLIPILTMKLLSEEKKNKTDQGLLTAPVGLWEIVLGKYFAALTLFIIAERNHSFH